MIEQSPKPKIAKHIIATILEYFDGVYRLEANAHTSASGSLYFEWSKSSSQISPFPDNKTPNNSAILSINTPQVTTSLKQ